MVTVVTTWLHQSYGYYGYSGCYGYISPTVTMVTRVAVISCNFQFLWLAGPSHIRMNHRMIV